MDYSEDFLKKVLSLGSLNYPLQKIISVLDIEDEGQFRKDFNNKQSAVFKAYNKGKDRAQFEIDKKIFELAKGGDHKSIEYLRDKNAKSENQDGLDTLNYFISNYSPATINDADTFFTTSEIIDAVAQHVGKFLQPFEIYEMMSQMQYTYEALNGLEFRWLLRKE